MKTRILLVISFLLMIHSSFAASVVTEVAPQSSNSNSITLVFVLGILIVLLLAILVMLYYMTIALRVMSGKKDSSEPLFDFTGGVPVDREHEVMMDHEYDGIRELDNNMPTWWKWMFYATVVFSFAYYYYYQFGSGDTQLQEYEQSMVAAEAEMKLHGSKVDENSATVLTDATAIEAGKTIFMENCAACHGKLGEGGVGPNFADDYWLHGGDIKSVFKTIKFGVPEKGMIPWQAQLSAVQIQEVSSFVLTFKGTNPPNAKAPQGDLVK
ncbi:cbb3-type cytochrome c oxidase N-terminal domain-containing protein [uncultured Cytophaga sp.]|uniref:cbb3-type cytochrome c oxidase N-terminal domain-containing protein n=1 Tax=uncultured Cytophaga sp. TaxID=160238 RepID=UPI00260563B6|nr:cbb3-type cytochrome c oxidase N-terminal domain-containing protein [uncultured Cytophaga sp.]